MRAGGGVSSLPFVCVEEVALLAQVDLPLPFGGALEGGPLGVLVVPSTPIGWTSLRAGEGLSPVSAATLFQRPQQVFQTRAILEKGTVVILQPWGEPVHCKILLLIVL